MAVTQFFRVAVEGATVDGRNISRDMIQQMADSYKPETYTARINCEHLRGYSPEAPFNAWGSVVALKAEEIALDIGGKSEKRLALFAQLDVTDQAKAYNQAGQKLFSSVEIQPDFAGTGKAYLVGFAVTDSPASLGTQVLKFSTDADRKNNLVQIEEVALAFEQDPAADASTGAFAAMKKFIEGFTKPAEPAATVGAPPAAVSSPAAGGDTALATFATGMAQQMEAMTNAFTRSFTALETRLACIDADQKKLAETIEATPSRNYTARPTGGAGAERALADC